MAYGYLQKLTLKPSDRLTKIKDYLEDVLSDSELQKCLNNLEKKVCHFDQVRAIMRLAPRDGKEGLNDDGGKVDMPKMKTELEEFIKTGALSKENQEFCDSIDWYPVDELELKEEYVKKLKKIEKGPHSRMTLEKLDKLMGLK